MEASASLTTREVAEAVLLDPQHRSRLSAYAGARFGIGREDAEDLLQETALELLRQRQLVRHPAGFVFTIFRARCARFLALRRTDPEPSPEGALEEVPGPRLPGTLDREIAIRQALEEVSSACRRLLCAYYVEGESLHEAARRLSLSYASVGKTMSRCLRRLRACLA